MDDLDFEGLVAEIAAIAAEKKLTVAAAESCTGGLVSARLVDWPGASRFFLEGAVAYSNAAKVARLGVKPETLAAFGAVSEQTAREMAEGAARSAGAACGVATTGIAGPDGGTPEKPVGLVFIAVSVRGRCRALRFVFPGSRAQIRERTALEALKLLRDEMRGSERGTG